MIASRSSIITGVVIFIRMIMCTGEKIGSAVEGTHHHADAPVAPIAPPQCNVCWSMESAAQCQRASKPEPCTGEQLDTTVSKLLQINPTQKTSVVSEETPPRQNRTTGQHRCYTLSAVSGAGDSRKVFYAKGCTNDAFDPCAGWAKEKGDCALCTGSNCNSEAPVEQEPGLVKHSGAGRMIGVSSSSSWATLAIAGTLMFGYTIHL